MVDFPEPDRPVSQTTAPFCPSRAERKEPVIALSCQTIFLLTIIAAGNSSSDGSFLENRRPFAAGRESPVRSNVPPRREKRQRAQEKARPRAPAPRAESVEEPRPGIARGEGHAQALGQAEAGPAQDPLERDAPVMAVDGPHD